MNILPFLIAVYKYKTIRVIIMKHDKFEIVTLPGDSTSESAAAYEKVCSYLLQRYCEGSEDYEGFNISESIDGGTSRKRLFDTSSENGRHE